MVEHWLIELIGHVSGLSDAQLKQIEKSLPATRALVDLLNGARPIIEQAQNLYTEAEPLIDQAKKEWETVGPAAQILIDVISHHVNRGSSLAEASGTVRAAFDGSIKSVAEDHLTDRGMSCATVFGGTGFVGRRVVRHLRKSGTKVRIVSRHRGLGEDDGLEQIAADARDQRSVEAAVAGADGVVNAISLYLSTEVIRFIRCTWKRPPRSQKLRARPGLSDLCTYQESAPKRPRPRPIFAAAAKVKRPSRQHFLAQSLSARHVCAG
jgi:NAD(P)H-binding